MGLDHCACASAQGQVHASSLDSWPFCQLSRQSPKVGIVDKEMRVLVKELHGTRARISEPYVGWISCVSGKVQVVTRHEASETIKQVTKDMLSLQKGQRDTLKSLERMKAKPLVPKLLGEANTTEGAARTWAHSKQFQLGSGVAADLARARAEMPELPEELP